MYGQPTPRVHELCAVTFHFSLRDSRQQKGQDCLSIHSSEANVQCSVSKCQSRNAAWYVQVYTPKERALWLGRAQKKRLLLPSQLYQNE